MTEMPNCHQTPNPTYCPQVQNNGVEVCSALHDVVRRYGLACNPNLCRDGVRGTIDPHGLVVVTACGTLHNAATCCGTFHQVSLQAKTNRFLPAKRRS